MVPKFWDLFGIFLNHLQINLYRLSYSTATDLVESHNSAQNISGFLQQYTISGPPGLAVAVPPHRGVDHHGQVGLHLYD